VQISCNTIPVQVLDKLGAEVSYDYMENKLGVSSLVDDDISYGALALGGLTNGISNMEITAAYSSFANKGIYNRPVLYTKIVDSSGKILLENVPKPITAFSEQAANIMTDMLISVVKAGTGTPANFSGKYSIAGKTGTTDDDRDRWFVGMTPYYVSAVWMGFDMPKTINFVSGNPTIPIWKKVMQRVHEEKKLSSKYFPLSSGAAGSADAADGAADSGVKKYSYCSETGLLPTKYCIDAGLVQSDYFPSGSAPKAYCGVEHVSKTTEPEGTENPEGEDLSPAPSASATGTPGTAAPSTADPIAEGTIYQTYQICSASGQLATQFCPPELVVSSTTAPSGVCTVHTRD
jgi:penicillin-binding protein 1A